MRKIQGEVEIKTRIELQPEVEVIDERLPTCHEGHSRMTAKGRMAAKVI